MQRQIESRLTTTSRTRNVFPLPIEQQRSLARKLTCCVWGVGARRLLRSLRLLMLLSTGLAGNADNGLTFRRIPHKERQATVDFHLRT
jgi:hypothetical protein